MENVNDESQFSALALNVIKYLKNINDSNCIYKFNKKKLCNNFINNKPCSHYNKGKCKFAHSFFELDESFQYEILKLGFEAYTYVHQNDYSAYNKNNKSLTKYLTNLKSNEELYKNEVLSLNTVKKEYSLLVFYTFKLFNEQKLILSKKYKFNTVNHNNSIIELKQNLLNNINDLITCKICYKPIVNDSSSFINNSYDHNKLDNQVDLNYSFVTLSCGHSICNNCHIHMINTKKEIFIKCPVCRNNNNITRTNPNFELNEIVSNLQQFYHNLNKKVNDIQNNIIEEEKKKYFTKYNNKIKKISFECPW